MLLCYFNIIYVFILLKLFEVYYLNVKIKKGKFLYVKNEVFNFLLKIVIKVVS